MWIDIASIIFISVTANHLGLINATEKILGRELPIVNCPKCLCFWCTLIYTSFAVHDVVLSLALSFLCSYLALWLELAEGYVDNYYYKAYEKIYSTTDRAADE